MTKNRIERRQKQWKARKAERKRNAKELGKNRRNRPKKEGEG